MTRAAARYGTVLADDEDAFIRLFPPFDGVLRFLLGVVGSRFATQG